MKHESIRENLSTNIQFDIDEYHEKIHTHDAHGNQIYQDGLEVTSDQITTKFTIDDKYTDLITQFLNSNIQLTIKSYMKHNLLILMNNIEMFGYNWWENYKSISNIETSILDDGTVIIKFNDIDMYNDLPIEFVEFVEKNLVSYIREKNINELVND